jgi:Chitin synthase
MYHQIKNVIGVNPTFYEYLFTVDADTVVDPMSVNRLISAYVFFWLSGLGVNFFFLTTVQNDPRQEACRCLR